MSTAGPGATGWHRGVAETLTAQGLPAAAMIVGQPGIGKRALAHDLAQHEVCGGSTDAEKMLKNGNHPDFLAVEPEPGTGKGPPRPEIKIGQIRELGEFCRITPAIARMRVAVIHPACTMNRNAASALLKLLEEPPQTARIVLVAHNPGRLPATVISRCTVAHAPTPPHDTAMSWLQSESVDNAAMLLRLCGGAPLAAADIAQHGKAVSSLVSFLSGETSLSHIKAAITALPPPLWIGWVQKWVCDTTAVAFGLEPRFYLESRQALNDVAKIVHRRPLLRLHRELLDTARTASIPQNPKLLAEDILGNYQLLIEEHVR